jgi:SPP1 family predicted phage head-tail adaptor
MTAIAYTLNKRVTLQQLSAARDAAGQPLPDAWVDVVTVWAGIRDLLGKQYVAAQATQNPVTSEITIRFREGVTAAMRVVHGADIYDVQDVQGQDRRTLKLMAIRGINNG